MKTLLSEQPNGHHMTTSDKNWKYQISAAIEGEIETSWKVLSKTCECIGIPLTLWCFPGATSAPQARYHFLSTLKNWYRANLITKAFKVAWRMHFFESSSLGFIWHLNGIVLQQFWGPEISPYVKWN
jgi:hypothetical protein